MDSNQKLKARFSVLYVVGALLAVLLLQEYVIGPMAAGEEEVPYSQFRQDLADGTIAEVTVEPERILYTVSQSGDATDETATERKVVRIEDDDLVEELVDAGVEFQARAQSKSLVESLFGWILPVLPFVVIWWFLMKRMGKGAGGMLSIGKSKATEISGEMTNVTFADVGGAEQVEVELKEIIEFLNHPERFVAVGAKLPKGILLVGPPGTGKTLLAKATAGEAGVPFFSISGSEFVEMFVGVGASRVRDLFDQAKAKAPDIIFIDEIDAIGQSRSGAMAVGATTSASRR
jgi:cell division protease FtsH